MSSGAAGAEEAVEAEKEAEAEVCCANCGIAEIDDIKLEECDGCDLVKYCSNSNVRKITGSSMRESANKRKALYDKELFKQPNGSHLARRVSDLFCRCRLI